MQKPLIWPEEMLGDEGYFVVLSAGIPEENIHSSESLSVKIYKPSINLPDAETLYRNDLYDITYVVSEGINILKNELTYIDNIPAYKLVYTFSISDNTTEQIAVKNHFYKVYFDVEGFIWNIELFSEIGASYRIESDFDHIVKTFKILD